MNIIPLHSSSEKQLLAVRGRFLEFADKLLFKADRLDVAREFSHAGGATKFRRASAADLARRSRHLRQQAGEIFGRVDAINAELEQRNERPVWLSDAARESIRDQAGMREAVSAVTSMPQTQSAAALFPYWRVA